MIRTIHHSITQAVESKILDGHDDEADTGCSSDANGESDAAKTKYKDPSLVPALGGKAWALLMLALIVFSGAIHLGPLCFFWYVVSFISTFDRFYYSNHTVTPHIRFFVPPAVLEMVEGISISRRWRTSRVVPRCAEASGILWLISIVATRTRRTRPWSAPRVVNHVSFLPACALSP